MMKWLTDFVESCLDFSNILNISITASWLVLAVLMLRFLLKKAPKWTHVVLWGLVAVRLLFPLEIESVFSLIPSTETLPLEILRYEGVQRAKPARLDIVTNPVLPESVTMELSRSVGRVQVHMVYLTLIWWCGMGVMMLYMVVSYLILQGRVRTAVRLQRDAREAVPSGQELQAVAHLSNIYQSENVQTPFVLGILKPRIYIPYKISEHDMPHVIAHEQAHIRRKDHWWKLLGFLLLTIHWFNPLMWVAYILLCRDIELACDESVIKTFGRDRRADYSQALLSSSTNRKMLAACPLAFGEVGVKERVKNVIQYKKPAFWMILTAVVACVVVAVCFLTNPIAPSDSLTFVEQGGISGRYSADFDAQLGYNIGSGTIRVEQWHQGECVQSAPLTLTKDVEELHILMTVARKESVASGVDIQIETDEYGGILLTHFAFPEGEAMMGWSFGSYELREELELAPGEERILAVMAFDNGSGVRVFDCETLVREPDRLKEAGYMIVVRAVFEREDEEVFQ